MGQMLYALFALTLYDRDPAGVDPGQLLGDLQKELTFFEKVPGTAMQCAFGHLHGYSSNYYTYMWSLVISKDFASVFGDDLMSTEKAQRYREAVLGQGGSDDAGKMAAAFLGRETSFEAWESWLQA
jgi:thimet oligopeptidase